jgi:MerR family redox-sensitive transcriptional activator SoxR
VTIGEISERTGLAPSALRFYEAEGLLPEPARVNGRRRYDESVLPRLAAIQVAQKAGFTIGEIRTLMTGFPASASLSARWRTLAERKLPEIDALIARAEAMKAILEEGLECGCARLEECAVVERYAEIAH